jgi:hypothetical protein
LLTFRTVICDTAFTRSVRAVCRWCVTDHRPMTILIQHRPAPAVAQGSPLVIFQLDGGKGPSRHTLKRSHGSLWVGVQGKPNRKRVISAHFLLA